VPVHHVGITPDGHPYLVMPLYPGASLADRARAERLGVEEVLRVGVQIGGAVEPAHRRGLLHSDLKPANILTSRYGSPGLTDFGLAGAPADADSVESGVSVPWSAPEVLFGTAPASVKSDVYSLAATLWTLLVGQSPFELPQGENRPAQLLRRIRATPAPRTGRSDVPDELEDLLACALRKDPSGRPASALELVRGLQAVERHLGGPVTEPVIGEGDVARAGKSAEVTRASALLGARRHSPAGPVVRGRPDHMAAESESGASEVAPERPAAAPRARRPALWGIVGFLAVAVLVAWASTRPVAPTAPDVAFTSTRTGDLVTFGWTYPGQRADDWFNVLVADRVVGRREPSIEASGPGRLCIRVQVLDAAGAARGGYSPESCSP